MDIFKVIQNNFVHLKELNAWRIISLQIMLSDWVQVEISHSQIQLCKVPKNETLVFKWGFVDHFGKLLRAKHWKISSTLEMSYSLQYFV